MDKNCLNCKYEPDWSKIIGKEYPRRTGRCKWPLENELPVFPHTCQISFSLVERYKDDSGICVTCKAWEPKK